MLKPTEQRVQQTFHDLEPQVLSEHILGGIQFTVSYNMNICSSIELDSSDRMTGIRFPLLTHSMVQDII
jgi:hypothetical protein